MKKLIQGIVDFRQKLRPEDRETFARLALGQSPDTLFIACSDSRVVPNTFASTDPGDLFMLRNVGNLIPPSGPNGISVADESEVAAIEFSILTFQVKHVVVCGHSECGAMRAICGGRERVTSPHLQAWLRHGEGAFEKLKQGQALDPALSEHNRLSQLNVLQQIENLMTYPMIRERVEAKQLHLHALWFDIAHAEVSAYEESVRRFLPIDPDQAARMLARMPE